MKPLRALLAHLPLVLGGLVLMMPLAWMVCVSLMTPAQAQKATGSATLDHVLPTDPQWQNYEEAMRHMGAARLA